MIAGPLAAGPVGTVMRFWTHDRYGFPLPPGHRFPLPKYRMLRERIVAERVAPARAILESGPVAWEELALVHDADFLHRVRTGSLSRREEKVIGLPWSPQLVSRSRRSTGGTLAAFRDAVDLDGSGIGMNLGGGTHHAGVASARGYCLTNDVAVAIAVLRRDGIAAAERVLVVDTDVHQGDGTAEIFASDPSVFTLSLQCERNYPFQRIPSDLDVELPAGTRDDAYLTALADALDRGLATIRPTLVVYLAGADPWEGDALGRLSVSKEGLARRDALVLDRALGAGAAVGVTLAGGYAPDLSDTVDVNLATVRAVLERAVS